MNSIEAYECSTNNGLNDKCKNCKYFTEDYSISPQDVTTYYCNKRLIMAHLYEDLKGCLNSLESLKILKADYEKEIEELNKEIKRLKLSMPVECCISNTLETENNISLNDLLKLPNVESVNIWLNKKENSNER